MKRVPLVPLQVQEKIFLGSMCEWALNNNGATINFGANTWYGIVDTIANLLGQAGEEWDNTYGTVEETYLYPSGLGNEKKLTAKRFNAVALNLEKVLHNSWRWEVDASVEKGFLGRARVRGFSEYGEKGADKVYGWYLLELVRVTNMFIDILQMGKYVEDLLGETNCFSNTFVFPLAPPASPLDIQISSDTKTNTSLLAALASEMSVQEGSQTKSYADMTEQKPIVLEGEVLKSKTSVESTMMTLRLLLLYTMSCNRSKISDLEMIVLQYKQMNAMSLNESSEYAEMKTLKVVQIESVLIVDKSKTSAEAAIAKPVHIGSEKISKTTTCSAADFCRPKPLIAEGKAYSISSSVMDKAVKTILGSRVVSDTKSNARVLGRKSELLLWNGISKTNTKAALSFYAPGFGEWYEPIQDGTDLYIRNVYMQHDEAVNVHIGHKFYEAERNGNDLYIKSVYVQKQYDDNLNVGLVYYKPEQTKTDIYIRSVESLRGV